MLDLSSLSPSKRSRKNRKRLGRGESSGQGKTAGKGHKGQKARSGAKIKPGFEGGQMPLYRRVPKIGFVSRKRLLGLNQYRTINLSDLEKFDDGSVVDLEALSAKGYGLESRKRAGIKVLGSGELTKKLTLRVHAVTKGARAKIEAAGGSVEVLKDDSKKQG